MPERSNNFSEYDFNGGGFSSPGETKARDPYVAPIVRFAFYAFVATIPFETVDLGIPLLEPTVITLAILLMSLVFQIPLFFQRPPLAYWLFFLYVLIFIFPIAAGDIAQMEEARWQALVVAQLVVMSWVAYNLMKSERVARTAVLVLALSCGLLAAMQFVGFTGETAGEGAGAERTTALGFHPNNIARILALGLLSLFGLAYGSKKNLIKPAYLVWFLFALIGMAIVQTGSRGALLALGAGIMMFVLREGSVAVKVRNAVLVLAGLGFFVLFIFQSDVTRERFIEALDDGDLARRELIYPTSYQMFLEKPIFGWGAKDCEYELGTRLGHIEESSKNPHNLILYVLIATGLVGAVPVLLGTGLAILNAWRTRSGVRGVLPLALITTVMLANMSGLWLHNKLHWVVIAYALSSTPAIRKKLRKARTGRGTRI